MGASSERERRRGFATRAVHGAVAPDVGQQPSSVPIYQTSTWRFDTSEDYADVISFRKPGYVYGRGYGNPTVEAFEGVMADLEGTEAAYGFASGMAALHTVFTALARAGDRVVASPELYGGADSLFTPGPPRDRVSAGPGAPPPPHPRDAGRPGAAPVSLRTSPNP